MAQAANQSKFSNVIIFEQAKNLKGLEELSKGILEEKKAAHAQPKQAEQKSKAVEDLNKNIVELTKVLKDQTKLNIKLAEPTIQEDNKPKAPKNTSGLGKSSLLRDVLLGGQKGDEVKKDSWFQKVEDKTGLKVGKFSPGQAIDSMLTKREEKQARAEEKKEFVKNAIKHDPNVYARGANLAGGVETKAGKEIATKKAEEQFEKIKTAEAELKKIQDKIDSAKAAGYAPLAKDLKAQGKAQVALNEITPQGKAQVALNEITPQGKVRDIAKPNVVKEVKTETAKTGESNATANMPPNNVPKLKLVGGTSTEDKEEYAVQTAEFEKVVSDTLIHSLEVQKQSLEQLKLIAKGGGGGGGDEGGAPSAGMFSGMSGIAKNLLAFSAALFITAKALQEFASVTWAGLLKGVLAMGALVIATNQLKESQSWKSLLALGASLWVISKALQEFNDVEWSAVAKGGLALLGLGLVGKKLGEMGNDSIKGAAALVILGGALWVVSKALQEFNQVDFGSIVKGGIALLGLVGISKLIGAGAAEMIMGAAALGIMGGAIWVIGKALDTFSQLDWTTIGKAMVAITGLGVIAAIAGAAAPLLFVGAAAIGAIGIALLPFAAAMAIAGPAMDQFAAGMERLSKISGSDLTSLAAGMGALSLAMVAFGSAQAIAGLGNLVSRFLTLGADSPVEQLIKIGQNGPGVIQAAEGLEKVSQAMQGFGKISKDSMAAINDFPWIRATAFVAAGGSMSVQGATVQNAKLASASKDTEDKRAAGSAGGSGGTNIVNAPQTNVVNNNATYTARSPVRNPESSVSRYIDSRVAA